LLAYFVYRRDWRLCLTAAVTTTVLSAVTLVWGWASYWPTFISGVVGASNGTANVLNQSLNGVLLRALHPGLNGLPIASPGVAFRAVWLVGQLPGP
jgi:hypothetical protein